MVPMEEQAVAFDRHALRQARERRGETQVEAAKCIGITPETLCRWENGAMVPVAGVILKAVADYIAKAPQAGADEP